MSAIKVFVSSTCYDLSMLRSELREFIASMGYEPVMSDYMDVLYDPRAHTHTSCIDEVANCDMLVVIIGSRFGGKSVPEAVDKIDISTLEKLSKGQLPSDKNFSITQLEVLKAIQDGIPVYTFIEQDVYSNHLLYEKNKNNTDIDVKQINFPAIEKKETAEYIFAFIDFIRLQSKGNSIFQFSRIQDIENILKRQWASYFQKLLYEQKYKNAEEKRMNALSDQFEDLKAAILSSIANADQKEIARGVVRYRRLTDFLFSLKFDISTLSKSMSSFRELLRTKEIVEIIDTKTLDNPRDTLGFGKSALIKSDKTFYLYRMPMDFICELELEWDAFKSQNENAKQIILETLYDTSRAHTWLMRYHSESIDLYRFERSENESDEAIFG